ncbi:MAG: hypothetical protein NUV69_02300 [Candidatus Curtissbacteria bacterium]|nr:hypothetical protein [Candidatus Curtissbacteria bacterium]
MGNKVLEQIQQIKKRLEKLESAVFDNIAQEKVTNSQNKKYDGSKGGILLLIDKNFFEKPRTAPQVKTAMAEQGYNYSIQVIQTTLNRLSIKSGPLTTMKEGKTKVYAKRK